MHSPWLGTMAFVFGGEVAKLSPRPPAPENPSSDASIRSRPRDHGLATLRKSTALRRRSLPPKGLHEAPLLFPCVPQFRKGDVFGLKRQREVHAHRRG